MYSIRMSNGNRIVWSFCCAILFLGIVSNISLALLSENQSVGEGHWNYLAIGGLNDDTAIFAVRRNANLILVGTREQGLFLSKNGGASWDHPARFQDFHVRDLWLHDTDPVVLMATFGNGLWRSTDGGDNWSLIDAIETPYCYCVVSWQDTQNTVFVGTANNGVWKSSNLGESWTKTGELDSPGVVALAAVSDQEIYAGSVDNGIFKTGNGGDTWDQIGFFDKTVRAVAVDPDNSDWLVASVLSDRVYQVHRSENAGTDWTPLNDGFDNASVLSLLITKISDDHFVLAGAIDQGVFRLDDDTWKPWGLNGRDILTLGSYANTLFAGTDHQVWSLAPGMRLRLENNPKGLIGPGQELTYRIDYENGPFALEDVQVSNIIPSNVDLGVIYNGGEKVGNKVVWELDTLLPNATGIVSYTVRRPSLESVRAPALNLSPPVTAAVNDFVVANFGAFASWRFDGEQGETRSNMVRNPDAEVWLPVITVDPVR